MKILKCDVCGQIWDGRTYELPHPEVRDTWEVCEECYESFGKVYRQWLETRGKKLKSDPRYWIAKEQRND